MPGSGLVPASAAKTHKSAQERHITIREKDDMGITYQMDPAAGYEIGRKPNHTLNWPFHGDRGKHWVMRLPGCFVLSCLVWGLGQLDLFGQPVPPAEHPLKLISPADGAVLESFLTAVLRWEYPQRPASAAPLPFLRVNLQVADNPQYSTPLVNVGLDDHQTSYRVALAPERKYY